MTAKAGLDCLGVHCSCGYLSKRHIDNRLIEDAATAVAASHHTHLPTPLTKAMFEL